MAETTKIQWCDHTFNPWRGCTKVHTGCANCYAERDAKRFPALRGKWGPQGTRVKAAEATWDAPLKWNADAELAGERRRVFCASLADLFEDWQGPIHDHRETILHRCANCRVEWASNEQNQTGLPWKYLCPGGCGQGQSPITWLTMPELRRDVFALFDRTPWLDWLVLTKRPERIRACWPRPIRCNENGDTLYRPNVALLMSASDQETLDGSIGHLLACRDLVPVLGVSAEPMLGPMNFRAKPHADTCLRCGGGPEDRHDGHPYQTRGLDWIIFGGESGGKARPCNLRWIMDGVEQCRAAGVAPFVKQLGAFPLAPYDPPNTKFPMYGSFLEWALTRSHYLRQGSNIEVKLKDDKGGDPAEWPEALRVREFPAFAREAVLA